MKKIMGIIFMVNIVAVSLYGAAMVTPSHLLYSTNRDLNAKIEKIVMLLKAQKFTSEAYTLLLQQQNWQGDALRVCLVQLKNDVRGCAYIGFDFDEHDATVSTDTDISTEAAKTFWEVLALFAEILK